MRALYQSQQERYKKEWYRIHKQTPPNLGQDEKKYKPKKYEPCTQTVTDTTVLAGFSETRTVPINELHYSYWGTAESGPDPLDYNTAQNTLKSDLILSHNNLPQPLHGQINDCFTPYENDLMAFGAFETIRAELEKRSNHLALEMKRVEDEFYRAPKKNWFCLKGSEFTPEHLRYNELQRRKAAKHEFADYYCAMENNYNYDVDDDFSEKEYSYEEM